jgi:prevent-host-death family protein
MKPKHVNIHQAKTHLSKLLREVEKGAEIIIAHGGSPVAKLIRFDPPHFQRRAGLSKGKIWMSDDFNDTPDDFKDYL